jgi:NADPH:quinone reductase-like Zn-dependent oxidoreductase
MPRAVQREKYGDVSVLQVVPVDRPAPGRGEVLVEVVAAAINPGEAAIRQGAFAERWPSTFPEGQGSDLAGRVVELGPDVTAVAIGDDVIGFTDNRTSHAELVVVPATHLSPKPAGVSWEVAGSLYVAGTTAYAAVRAVSLRAGETVVVSAAAGGVGSLTVQLAKATGARVIGIAGPANHEWLRDLGVEPIAYGNGLLERLRDVTPDRIDAFIDTFGAGYVELALDLGVAPERIDTIADMAAVEKYGVKAEGNAAAGTAAVIAELADLVADGRLTVPIARTYPLEQVADAFTELEKRHTRGKIVLLPGAAT